MLRTLAAAWLMLAASIAAAEDFDVLIRGGTVYDGSGAPGRKIDVGLRGDRIVAIGKLRDKTAKQTVNAAGLAVAPGFINMLSWATDSLLVDGNSQSDIRQGVTLELLGEGMTMGPLNDAMKQQFGPRMRKLGVDLSWTTLGQYLELLEKRGVSPNVASFVGATTVRLHVIGAANRAAVPTELQAMQQLVRDAMQEGAFGVSSALAYAPATFANTDELIALSKAAAEFGGIYISHIRDEGDRLVESVEEVIEIARSARVPAEIYHLKALGAPNWNKLDIVIDRIEAARKAGVRITADMYPYTASATGLDVTMPPWVQDGGLDAWVARLKDPAVRARLLEEMKAPSTPTWSNRLRNVGSPENVLILGVKSPGLQSIVGKTLGAVARERGTSVEDTVIDLVIEDGSRLQVAYFLMSEENIRRAISLPWMSFGSDAGSPTVETAVSQGPEHPRAYGTFARVLGKYVREDKVVSLEEAVRRLSSLPAQTLGIEDRGRIEVGRYADVVIFEPAAIADRSTFADPHRYAIGMRHVFVNGVQVLADGEHTGARPGRFVRHRGRAVMQ
ncbi:N-acyl-D-amino-acid deacylase family protein [Peristeroidobacter soli]|uniref:N-acyl-D-amino-acid deacylase family protein n=1 Tax=Peristeroidobacter soli TaxID=2497877 RepID=UPI001C3767FC|nr:D-aminoacylase [Peristeroidobacter soli]